MDELMQHGQAAEYLGISTVQLWKLVKKGRLSAYKGQLDGRKKFYKISDLEKLKGVKKVK